MRLPGVALLFAVVALGGATGCLKGPAVAREVDGRAIDDRWIPPEAYASFAEGALLEESGNRPAAAVAYERALDEDGAAEIWARLGGVRCTENARASNAAFSRARAKGPKLEAVWLSDAACALERGETRRARESALRAAALAPDRLEASLLVVAALVRTGEREGAAVWLRVVRISFPEAATLDSAPEAVFGDPKVSRLVPAAIRIALAAGAPQRPPRASEGSSAIDEALTRDDAEAARRAAVRTRVGLSVVAVRAAELGRPEIARETAEQVLAAEPTSVEARVAALAAADLARDDRALRRWASPLPPGHDAPSPAAIRVMAALLERRVGTRAARSFVTASGGK